MVNQRRRSVPRRLGTQADAGTYLGKSTRTIRQYIADGKLTAYHVAGTRTVRVDMDEVEALVTPIPTVGTIRDAAS